MGLTDFLINNFVDSAYCVGYRYSDVVFWDEDKSVFKLLKPTVRYWYADPIPCKINDEIYVFMEQFDRLKRIGRIAAAKVDHKGKLSKPVTVIKEETHLSFPMIIPYKQEYYMIPEASETGSIVIYKMQDSPFHWKHYYKLDVKERIVDIAFDVINDDTIQLFTGIIEDQNSLLVKRKIYQLHHLEDRNKISFDEGYEDETGDLAVRNGGNIYLDEKNNKKYRIVQESTSSDYGMYILRNEINRMNLDIIDEETINKKTVENLDVKLSNLSYRKIGIHTYGICSDSFEVIDIAVTKFSLYPLFRKMGLITK